MDMPKHTDAAKAAFRALVAGLVAESGAGDIEVRPMFGSVGAFVNGTMFAGLFGDAVGIKPDAATLAEVEAMPGAGPFGPPQRPMNGWVSLPADLPDDQRVRLLEQALAHVRTLPPKKPRAAKKTATEKTAGKTAATT